MLEASVQGDLPLLYELSLAIGRTLDPQATCLDFLGVLSAGCQLDGASIWWPIADETSPPSSELCLLAAIPRTQVGRERLPLAHPFRLHGRDGQACSFATGDPEFASLLAEHDGQVEACALVPLGDDGVLVMYSAAPAGFSPSALARLDAVLGKLATAIRNGMAFARLQRSEAGLRETNRRLAEAQRNDARQTAELETAHALLHALIHSLPDLVWLKDPTGTYLACNQRFERFFGAAAADIVGKTDRDFVDRKLADFFREHDRVAMARGGPSVNEEWLTFADGHRELMETTKTPMYDAAGHLIGVLGIGHDVTERKRISTEFEQGSLFLTSLLNAIPLPVFYKDTEGRYLGVNAAFEKFHGKMANELVGRTVFELAGQRELAEIDHAHDLALVQHPELQIYEAQVTSARGETRLVIFHKAPLLDHQGRLRGLVGVMLDMTERKRIESEIERHRQHLEELVQQRTSALLATETRASHILQSSADGLYGVDPDGSISFINAAACTLLGYRAEQLIGASAHAIFHHSRPDGSPCPIGDCVSQKAILHGRTVRVHDEVYWHADGHAVPVMYAVHPMLQNGCNTGAVISFVDMSEQRAAADARERALIVAENLVRMRSEFLANMSHEIRTPMNGVLGFAQIGKLHYRDSDKARNAFEKILASGNRLMGVVNGILDFSAIEAGRLSIEQTEVPVHQVIDRAVELVRDRAHAKSLDLRVERAADLPATCIGDPLRIGQVLLNLLSNAVKFTAAGSIVVRARCQGEQLVFTVSDTGIGISGGEIEHLFNPFQQADASITRKFGGTGLGLAISKRLVELMAGDIRVDSRLGRGSTFEFWLPLTLRRVPATQTGSATAGPSETRQSAGRHDGYE